MPYVTKANMIARFSEAEIIQRTDRAEPPLEAIDDSVLNGAMTRADAYADDALRGRYAVPVAAPSLTLVTFAENLARRYLYDDGMSQAVKDGYEEAIAWFAGVSRGTIKLDAPAADSTTAGGTVGEASFAETTNAFADPF